MKKYILTAAVLLLPTIGNAQGIEIETRCISFLDIYNGNIATDPRTVGYVEGYVQGAVATMRTTRTRAEQIIQEACDQNPQFTMWEAVMAAQESL